MRRRASIIIPHSGSKIKGGNGFRPQVVRTVFPGGQIPPSLAFGTRCSQGVSAMLRLAIVFLVIALIAAVFGFGGVAAVSVDAARILFFVFLVLAVLSVLVGAVRGRGPKDLV